MAIMSLLDTCFGSYDPASSLISQLPAGPGQAREDAIRDMILGGSMPYALRQWVEVPVSSAGHVGTLYVLPDYLSVGTDDDFVRTPMSPLTAETIAHEMGGRLPTKKMVDAIHVVAEHIPADPWGPPYDASMMSTERFVAHNAKVETKRKNLGISVGALVSGHKKDVVVSPNMTGSTVCIYGWFTGASPSTAIQGPTPNCKSHEVSYSDYSHGIRVVRDVMLVDGQEMLVDDVMRDPNLCALVSDQGAFTRTRYIESQSPTPSSDFPIGTGRSSSIPGAAVVTFLAFGTLGYLAAGMLWDVLS